MLIVCTNGRTRAHKTQNIIVHPPLLQVCRPCVCVFQKGRHCALLRTRAWLCHRQGSDDKTTWGNTVKHMVHCPGARQTHIINTHIIKHTQLPPTPGSSDARWSAPLFFNSYGSSVGLTLGVSIVDSVIILDTAQAVAAFTQKSQVCGLCMLCMMCSVPYMAMHEYL